MEQSHADHTDVCVLQQNVNLATFKQTNEMNRVLGHFCLHIG